MLKTILKSAPRMVMLCLGSLLISASVPVVAQSNYPNKPIRLIVPFAPGGVTDTSGRLIADQLSRRIGQTIVVENKPGASGNIGAAMVANAEPDGYTLVLGFDGTIVINPHILPPCHSIRSKTSRL